MRRLLSLSLIGAAAAFAMVTPAAHADTCIPDEHPVGVCFYVVCEHPVPQNVCDLLKLLAAPR